MIRPAEVLARYDEEMRRGTPPIPGSRVEVVGPLVRVVGRENFVIYSALTESNARAVVAEQVEYFLRAGTEVEWKVFGHDLPANLEEILAAAGFVPEAPETVVVLDLADGVPRGPTAPGVEIRRVNDEGGARDALTANEAAFGTEGRRYADRYSEWLHDPTQGLYVAYAGGSPVASARLELTPGRSFAGLWGGGVAPAHRGKGIYRGLVGVRAAAAKDAGYRYLTVDAQETSRPILERLGFVALTTTRPWVLRPSNAPSAGR
jgi:GNAT superfamily N-acetyltransferase